MSIFPSVLSGNFVSGAVVKTGFSSFTEECQIIGFFPLLSFPILLLNTFFEGKKRSDERHFFPPEIKKRYQNSLLLESSPQDELKYIRFLFLCVKTQSMEVALKTCQRTS